MALGAKAAVLLHCCASCENWHGADLLAADGVSPGRGCKYGAGRHIPTVTVSTEFGRALQELLNASKSELVNATLTVPRPGGAGQLRWWTRPRPHHMRWQHYCLRAGTQVVTSQMHGLPLAASQAVKAHSKRAPLLLSTALTSG